MAGAPASLSILSGSGQSAVLNTTFGAYCRVHCQDAQGNPVANAEIWYECPRGGSQPTGGFGSGQGASQNLFTDSNGDTNGGNALYAIVSNGAWSLNAYVSGHKGQAGLNVNFALTNGANVPASITATSGGGQAAYINNAFSQPFKATVKDGLGLPVPNASVTFTLPYSSTTPIATGTFSGGLTSATATTDVNGVATSPTITAGAYAGSWTGTAKVTSVPSLTASYGMTNNVVLVPTNLVVTGGGGAQSADILTAFPIRTTVYVTDQYGGPINGAGVDFSTPGQTGPSGTMTGHYTTDSSGHATSSVITANNHAGNWTGLIQLSAAPSVQAAFGPQTNTVPVSPPTPTFLSITGGGSQVNVPGGAYQPVTVRQTDQFGDGIGGNVTISVPSSANGTFPGGVTSAVFTCNSSGVGTSPVLTAGATLGSFTVTVAGPQAPTTSFNNMSASTPYAQFIYSGNGQASPPSTAYGAPLVTKVVNAAQAPISGVSVVFTAPGSGASVTFAGTGTATQTVTTDVNGLATTSAMTANATTGSFSVSSAVSGLINITFGLRNANTYGPVACNTQAAPTAPVNNATLPAGATINWTNPGSVVNATGANVALSTTLTSYYLDLIAAGASAIANIQRNDKPTTIQMTFTASASAPLGNTGRLRLSARFGAQLLTPVVIFAGAGAAITNQVYTPTLNMSGFNPRPIGQDFIDGLITPVLYFDTNGVGGTPNCFVKSLTWGVCYQPQGSYVPEVCTSLLAPANAALQTIGTNAIGAWSTPGNAVATGGGGAYAQLNISSPGSGSTSQWVVGTPQNAAQLAAINDAALVSVVGAELWLDTSAMTNNGGKMNVAIIIAGAVYQTLVTPASFNAGVGWLATTVPITDGAIPSANPITWAQFKAANCGVGFQFQSVGGNPGGNMKVNGLRVKICYNNPAAAGGGGMLWCEC